ncbi:LysR family transcriptional regulator [Cupriavidus sp. 2TAF22]|uniref:LysR family transcriptional regulator n=1 Tax=unclassified Cupriavidus TaxID=2640874 RepID=UPI003F92D01B
MDNLLRKLDLTSLRLFVAVCQEQNIARAAEREFIAPSAVSRRIGEIEALIGLPVIQRHPRGITVTPVGEAVLRHALAIIGNIESLGAELSRFSSGARGAVRMVCNLGAIVQFLPEDLAAFGRVYPDIDIALEEQHSPEVLRLVGERSADFGICNAIQGVEQFVSLPYREDQLCVLVPRGHRLEAAPQVRFADLLGETFVALRDESALSRLLLGEAARLNGALRIKMRVASLDALCRMVHVGLGIAIVPRQVGELYVNTLDVACRPLVDGWATRQLVVVFHSREHLSASAAALVDFLCRR